ncbi:MAG: hypothetical protein HOW73_18265 [Polyangiaceae bacterium]|nr:hypothetical protein [Polyangiaceae bacterium]
MKAQRVALDLLPAGLRRILEMRYFEEIEVAVIATAPRMSSVKVRHGSDKQEISVVSGWWRRNLTAGRGAACVGRKRPRLTGH